MNFSNESFVTNATSAPVPSPTSAPVPSPTSAPVPSPTSSPAVPAVIAAVAALTIAGNLVVIVATAKRQTFPAASRLFVFSMAWSDLFVGLTSPFMVAPATAGEWVYSDTAVQTFGVIGMSSTTITYSSLAGLNLDRYHAVLNNGEGVSHKNARIFLISTWAGIYAFYIFCEAYAVPFDFDRIMALPTCDLKAHIWFTTVTMVIMSVALVVTTYCVVRVLKAVCTPPQPPAAPVIHINMNGPAGVPPQNANNPEQQPPAAPHYHGEGSCVKAVLILTLAQTALPLPFFCTLVAHHVGYELPTALFWTMWVALSNNFLDVVVHSAFHKSFRKSVVEIARSTVSGLYNVCYSRNGVNVDQQGT
ncbi:PREDICTED: beta-3 adrenergic receptor-like [Branchiostoma belcheri]|uniref:Beta-3 adrenergic receptor-like n=1 Tax=Branchiostoma belcheri TaxID=7741 RepID=A0A6P4YRN8_BRABE|nr:PREDICTED: beta-3 adrenergic receptor-like [Branchiostoma belcheri]